MNAAILNYNTGDVIFVNDIPDNFFETHDDILEYLEEKEIINKSSDCYIMTNKHDIEYQMFDFSEFTDIS